MTTEDLTALAFGEGCNARIAGLHAKVNPYSDEDLRRNWLRGWRHVTTFWGVDATWPTASLPQLVTV